VVQNLRRSFLLAAETIHTLTVAKRLLMLCISPRGKTAALKKVSAANLLEKSGHSNLRPTYTYLFFSASSAQTFLSLASALLL